ncbi:slit homolog 1 protein-like isoform X2 [Octopus sinensis]|uniref:Slit homolog 1 protein-like isoform X2 n=1 Tax=Octopus sinensis TaxID=2607531 RepID=A0A7E6EJU7_9MOLL|nr:slit homolog 1 protein-like isoform X2 [Octopus sinensis]
MFHHVVSYRRSLVLILCTILFLETQADSDICKICTCNSLTTRINCARRNLLSIPQPIPTNVEYLYLSENNISTIKEGAFTGLSHLKELSLSYNYISRIEKEMFQGLHNLERLDLYENNISTIKEGTFTGLSNLKELSLDSNKISRIEKEMFQGLHNLEKLDLRWNNISTIKEGLFTGLSNLKTLGLRNNKISRIEKEMFQGLHNLEKLSLSFNKISRIEKEMFQGLHNLEIFYLENNNLMKCGCHLPAFVKYIKKVYNRTVAVSGTCQEGSGKRIPILDYSQCQNYSLFQRNLQCQTCSGIKCNKSEVTSCPGTEPVCRFAISMNGAKLKTERSCSTYRKCVEAMRNNTLTCNKRTNGTSCTGCCVGHLCNRMISLAGPNPSYFV